MSFVILFSSITSTTFATARFANGGLAPINHISTVSLSLFFTLYYVLCVLSFYFNLISLNKFIHSLNCFLNFHSNSRLI